MMLIAMADRCKRRGTRRTRHLAIIQNGGSSKFGGATEYVHISVCIGLKSKIEVARPCSVTETWEIWKELQYKQSVVLIVSPLSEIYTSVQPSARHRISNSLVSMEVEQEKLFSRQNTFTMESTKSIMGD